MKKSNTYLEMKGVEYLSLHFFALSFRLRMRPSFGFSFGTGW